MIPMRLYDSIWLPGDYMILYDFHEIIWFLYDSQEDCMIIYNYMIIYDYIWLMWDYIIL